MDSGKKQQQPHIVLVHGAGHGAWTWYKLKPLLEAAGHRVTAFDLAATGTDLRRLQDLCSFDDYNQPLLEILAAIPPPEKVVLVGHSLGGVNLAAAMERYPDSISVAVFVTAFLPDLEHKPSYVMEQFVERIPAENWEDTQFSPARPPESPLSSMTFGPKFISDRLYNLSPPEDVALGTILIRPSSLFLEDLSQMEPLSKERFGAVKKVYIVCGQDIGIPASFQRWMIEANGGVDEVVEIAEADHMAMLSTPRQLSESLTKIAAEYH
ncbi:salicylic acid-binding protein 2-like isoform X1 [Andrographis paniculata]|uniref:salicylic acid-binding protein 2-like isoform X1 n=1 Tax=Andrographis paniculata TaxID=175694 RepID=UPI0021E7D037|nr:salicylic acid-binding protein 2-like isoform X1 [Andrographis paniculata]